MRSVSVKVGKRVRRNQVLARLDPQSLDATVTAAVATLAKAKAQLVNDEDAQSDAVAATAAAEQAARKAKAQARKQAKAQAAANAQAAAAQSAAQAELRKQQQAVTSAQSAASDALGAATAALKDQQSACSTTTGTSTDSSGQACSTALAKVQDAQQTVAAKQQALQTAIAALARTVTSSIEPLVVGLHGLLRPQRWGIDALRVVVRHRRFVGPGRWHRHGSDPRARPGLDRHGHGRARGGPRGAGERDPARSVRRTQSSRSP